MLLVVVTMALMAPVVAAADEAIVAVVMTEAAVSAQSALPGVSMILGVALASAVLLFTALAVSRRRHSRSPPLSSSASAGHSGSTNDVLVASSGQDGRSIIGRMIQSLRVSDVSAAQT